MGKILIAAALAGAMVGAFASLSVIAPGPTSGRTAAAEPAGPLAAAHEGAVPSAAFALPVAAIAPKLRADE